MTVLAMDDQSVGWLAGLLEGEGCFGVSWGDEGAAGRIRIEMVSTDLDVLERARKLTGAGHVNGPYAHRVFAKPQWRWRVSAQPDVHALVRLLRPLMLSRRRAKIDELLSAYPEGVSVRACKAGGNARRPDRQHAAVSVATALGTAELTAPERRKLTEVLTSLRAQPKRPGDPLPPEPA